MRLSAALVPPRDVVEDLAALVRAVRAPEPAPEHRGRPLRGRHQKARGGDRPGRPPETPVESQLDPVPVPVLVLPLCGFGSVTLADGRRLADALRAAAASWPPVELRVAGGTALEFPGDQAVWARLDGDVDDLLALGRAVPQAAQGLGFFVDRRTFRPWLSVGTITEHTTAPYLERLVAALEEHRSRAWTADHLTLLRRPNSAEGADVVLEEFERLPLRG